MLGDPGLFSVWEKEELMWVLEVASGGSLFSGHPCASCVLWSSEPRTGKSLNQSHQPASRNVSVD